MMLDEGSFTYFYSQLNSASTGQLGSLC
jgi:hypothetical protein